MFKVNNRNTRTRCEICSKLTINLFLVSFEHISHLNFEQVNAGWEVYSVINYLNKNLVIILFDILKGNKGMTLKLCQLLEYYIRNNFMEKSCRKHPPNASPKPPSNFGK